MPPLFSVAAQDAADLERRAVGCGGTVEHHDFGRSGLVGQRDERADDVGIRRRRVLGGLRREYVGLDHHTSPAPDEALHPAESVDARANVRGRIASAKDSETGWGLGLGRAGRVDGGRRVGRLEGRELTFDGGGVALGPVEESRAARRAAPRTTQRAHIRPVYRTRVGPCSPPGGGGPPPDDTRCGAEREDEHAEGRRRTVRRVHRAEPDWAPA